MLLKLKEGDTVTVDGREGEIVGFGMHRQGDGPMQQVVKVNVPDPPAEEEEELAGDEDGADATVETELADADVPLV